MNTLSSSRSQVEKRVEETAIDQVNMMCTETLPPHLYNEWARIRAFLVSKRKNLKS